MTTTHIILYMNIAGKYTIWLEIIMRIRFDQTALKLHFKNMTGFNLTK